jgi:hypothetical protein
MSTSNPPVPSLTRRLIATISKDACQPLLAPLGFRRSAPHFWRLTDGLSHCVNFQASAWGTRDGGSFTINLGVSSPALYESAFGRQFPKVPASPLWPISTRIGFVMPAPQRDLWWDIDESTDVAKIGVDVVETLRNHAIPWFERLSTRSELKTAVEYQPSLLGFHKAQAPLVLAIFAAEEGDLPRAQSILEGALDDSRRNVPQVLIRRVASRWGITLSKRS